MPFPLISVLPLLASLIFPIGSLPVFAMLAAPFIFPVLAGPDPTLVPVVKFLVEVVLVLSTGNLESDPVALTGGLLVVGVVFMVLGGSTFGVPNLEAVFVLLDVVAGFFYVLGVLSTDGLVVYALTSVAGLLMVEVAVFGFIYGFVVFVAGFIDLL